MDYAYINPGIAQWARERCGFSEKELAGILRVTPEQVTQWEGGQQHPPFGRAQELAKALKIPFGYLFLSTRPPDKPPIPDLRSVSDRGGAPSPDFVDLLNDVLVKHDWYVEYAKEHRAERLPFVGSNTLATPLLRTVTSIREAIAPDELRVEARNWSDYLRLLVESAEDAGIIVMRAGVVRGNQRRSLSVAEFRGFVITDPLAPLIFINGKDAQAAQIFTLAHELVHIWIGQSGISNPTPAVTERQTTTHSGRVEQYCNEVAVELLVPGGQFDEAWRKSSDLAAEAERLARKFRVSVPVILRRAHERGHITRNAFFSLLQAHQEKVDSVQKRRDEEDGEGGGNFYNTFFARNSHRLTQAVLASIRSGGMSTLEAARLLNVRTVTIPKLLDRAG